MRQLCNTYPIYDYSKTSTYTKYTYRTKGPSTHPCTRSFNCLLTKSKSTPIVTLCNIKYII